MAVDPSVVFPQELISKDKVDPIEVKAAEVFDLSDEHSDTVYAASPEHGTPWASYRKADVSHEIISSYFIGPQAENLKYFENNIHTILEELRRARNKYYPRDGVSDQSGTVTY
jgi:hypothetical protein